MMEEDVKTADPVGTPVADLVRWIMASEPGDVLALHVAADQFGASLPFRKALRDTGLDVQDLNQVYEDERLADRLAAGYDMALARIFGAQLMRVVYFSGWGSDPRAADRLLAAVYPHVARRSNLRLVVMNNASPPCLVQDQTIAHPEPEEFAGHVAARIRIPRDRIRLEVLRRHDGQIAD